MIKGIFLLRYKYKVYIDSKTFILVNEKETLYTIKTVRKQHKYSNIKHALTLYNKAHKYFLAFYLYVHCFC